MTTKKQSRCGYKTKGWRYVPTCSCCRCWTERVVWQPAMARLQA